MTKHSQEPLDPVELQRIHDWIDEHGAPGQPCDECTLPLVVGEPSDVATAQTPLGPLLFIVCERCKTATTPNIQKAVIRFNNRLVSEGALRLLLSRKKRLQ